MNRGPWVAPLALVAIVAMVGGVGAGVWTWATHDARPVVRLPPGVHPALTLDRPVVVEGEPGAIIRGGITVVSDDVTIRDVTVVGGENGVTVRDASGVVLERLVVRNAVAHGIEVASASATIRGCAVSGLRHEYAQGIEIRNNNGRPRTVVEGCRVNGGRDGIVTHASRVEFYDNVVTATTDRAIAVTEMSEGLVRGNRVVGVQGAAYFCGDMSRCDVRGNEAREVTPDPAGVRSRSGHAFVAWYRSFARVTDNIFDVSVEPIAFYDHSTRVVGSPLSRWPPGWPGALPGVGVTAGALGLVVLLRIASGSLLRLRRGQGSATGDLSRRESLGRDVLVTIGLVQAFHIVEHVVQVYQVKVAWTEARQGLVGQHFNTEWLHLGFNTVVLAGVVVGAWLLRERLFRGPLQGAGAWLVAGGAVQAWHVVEHVARVVQFLDTGRTPAPGIFGDDVGLVWFHYGINVPVMVGLLAVLGCLLAPWATWRSQGSRGGATKAVEDVGAERVAFGELGMLERAVEGHPKPLHHRL